MGGKLKNRIRVDITIPEEIHKRLKEYSERTMAPVSRIVERAVVEFLDKEEKK